MTSIKPQLPKGTRDLNALQVTRRNWIFNTIQQIYQQYGFTPLETPALEQLSTLTGQYGQEGEQLTFKILNSGDFLSNIDSHTLDQGYKAVLPHIADKGLRYDLTVPLMRYVATHQHELSFPFRRYQIQPVWRADRPQKGRYREFYQCDADIVGSSSLLCEAEILAMAYQCLQKLGLTHIQIQINHRAILKGIVSLTNLPERENDFCVTIDKLEKIGKNKVLEELSHKGFSTDALQKIQFIFELQGTNTEKLSFLKNQLASSEAGHAGIQAIEQVLHYLQAMGLADIPISLEPTLARGLTYYTGTVFEVKLFNLEIGSIGGGGRYDNLAAKFGVPGLTGIGFSFGVERLYTAIEELGLFPAYTQLHTQILFTNLDLESEQMALSKLLALRNQGIRAAIYPIQETLKKQLNYANKKQIPWVIIIGQAEKDNHQFILKHMESGQQTCYDFKDMVAVMQRNLPKTL